MNQTDGGYNWSNTNDDGWSSRQNTNNDGWSSWQNTNSGDDGDWSSWRNTNNDGGSFLRQLVENRDLPSSSINDLRDRYSDLLSSLQDNQLDRYRGRSPSRTPPTSPVRSPSTPPCSPSTPPWRTSSGRRSESPPPFDWYADRGRSETPPISRTSSRRRSWSPSLPQDAGRDHSSVEETRGASLSPRHSPARDRNLIGLGINPRDWPEQPASTSDPSHLEMEQINEERQIKEIELQSWIDAGRWPVFENTRAENLAAELDTAEDLGIKPLHIDDPSFGQVASEGPIKWVVTESGELLVASNIIAHTVLTNGDCVVAAGEALIAVDGNERTCIEINTNSEHYQSDERSLEVGRHAFEQFGVRFAEEERLHDSGYGEGTSGIGASDATASESFENMRPESLAAELETAEMLGIRPMRVDDPDFEQMANQSEGQIIWVVLDSSQLLTAPSYVAHTVLSAGEAVIAAGNAIVAINGNERFCIEITTNSDHYQSDDQSLEIGKQAFEQFGVRFAEEERPRDGGYGEGTSGVGGSDAPTLRVFENTRPEGLAAELETAEMLGIRPMHVDDPDFEQMANQSEGQIIWVVLESGQLLTAPSCIAHTVLSAGEAVIAAGDAIVAINGNERFCIEITNNSDHYQSDDQSLEIGKQAFGQFGVRFAEEERPRDDGYGEGTSGVGAYNAAHQEEPRVFANTHPEDLAAELETAEILGISSMHVDDPDFRQLANDGPIKWVVTQGGDLLVASNVVAHTVLTNGEAVIAAGEAEVEVNGHKRGLAINTKSDHYQADERSLEIGRRAFEAFGVEFSSAAGRDGSGDGHGGVAVAVQPEMIEHAPPSPRREGLEQQASTSGTSHLEVVQELEAREIANGGHGDGNDVGNGGDGGGNGGDDRYETGDEESSSSSSDDEGDRFRRATKKIWRMLASRKRAEGEGTSQGGGAQVEYERGESSQAQLPEVGARQGTEWGDGNIGGHDEQHRSYEARSLTDRLVEYIDEALLRSISESNSNVDITVRRDEARREAIDALKEVLREKFRGEIPDDPERVRKFLEEELGIELPRYSGPTDLLAVRAAYSEAERATPPDREEAK